MWLVAIILDITGLELLLIVMIYHLPKLPSACFPPLIPTNQSTSNEENIELGVSKPRLVSELYLVK